MWGLEDDFAFEAAYGGGSDQTDVVLDSSSIAAFCEKVALRKVSRAELALHKSADDCWVALHGTVYDLTKFAKSHVGGSDSITKLAGKDGTDAFARKHGANVLNSLTGDCIIGEFSSDDAASTQGGYMIVDDIIKSIDSGDPGASNVVQSIPWVADVAEGNSHASAKRPRTDVSSESVETHPPRAIVIGGGLAGMSAANTIIEYGGKVVLVEKAAFCGGNSTKATSGINGACTPAQKSQAIVDSSDIFEADTLVGGARNPQIAKVLCQNSGEAIQWLVDNFSLDLSQVSQLGGHSRPRTHRGKERFPGMMITYALIQAVERYAETGDMAQIVTKARAARLLMDSDGTCVGCAYEQAGVEHELRGPVILATGGFAADFGEQSLLAQYRPDLLHLPTTNSEQSTGDGIKMGENIGAKTIDLEWVQVHPTGLVDIGNPDSKVKFLAAEALRGAGGLIIDGDGRRILNELGRRDDTTGQMWKHKPPFRLILNRAASQEVFWHCKHYASRNVMKYYETGKEFAEDSGVPLFVLEQTHEEHFQAARKQQEDPEGGPWPAYPNGRSWDEPSGSVGTGKKFFRNVICGADFSSEPFYVAVVTPVLHYCMGGLEADATAAVLGRSGDAIRGLWAAGEVVGGVHGNNRLGGNSLLDCVVFGRISGQECARYMLGSTATSRSIAKGSQEKALLLDSDANLAQSLTLEDVAKHRSEEDCWIVVSGRVLNVTSFLKEHPGGALPILACAGRDATAEFDAVHPPDMISKYASGFVVGYVRDKDDATLPCRAEPAMNNVSSAPAFVAKLSELPSNVYCPCCRRAVADSHRDENHIRAKCLECGIEFTIERLHK